MTSRKQQPVDLQSARLTRRRLLAQSGALAGAGLLAGRLGSLGGGSALAQDATPVPGGTLTWAVEILDNTLPFGAVGQPATHVMTYDSLMQWNEKLLTEPGLAESWTAPDDKTYVFKLRQGVKFHDGAEMTADDVKYSIDIQRNPPAPGQSFSFYPKIDNVEVVDKYTVKINLTEPDPSLMGFVTWTRYSNIMPKDMDKKINFLSEEDGTGPFKLTDFEASDHASLVKNPGYWAPNTPYLDALNLVFQPDEAARVAALQAGAIDGSDFSADTANSLKGNDSFTILSGLQANHREIQVTTKGSPQPWHDIRVRQAITHAINRQEIIDKVYGGEAQVSGVMPTGYGDWPLPVDQLTGNYLKFDLDHAKQLMSDAGYANGFSVTLQSIAKPADITQCAEMVQEQLKAINIKVDVQPLEFAVFAKNNGAGDFDMQLTQRGFRGDPSGYTNEFMPKAAIYAKWFGDGWKNDQLNTILEQALSTADIAKRKDLYTQAQQTLLTEAVHITLVQPMVYYVVAKRVRNMNVSFSGDIAYGLKHAWVQG